MNGRVIAIVGTGGTIANTVSGRMGLADLIESIEARFPDGLRPSDGVQLRPHDVMRTGSETFGPAEWIALGKVVREIAADPEVSGLVVTHGTFSVEETAFFLHIVVPTDKPMAMAVSQRKHGTIGNDGDRNLLDAVRVAACDAAAGAGVLVVAGEEIHSGREIHKTSRRPGGFSSGYLGILGTVDQDRVRLYRTPTGRHTVASEFDVATLDDLPRVDVVASYPGADGIAVDALVGGGARGLVVDGFAYSGVPYRDQLPSLERAAAEGVAVVLASRGRGGRIPVVDDDAFVRGDNLSAQKARVLLSVALTTTTDREKIQRIFSEY